MTKALKSAPRILFASVILACCAPLLRADYIMGPPEVNKILKSIQKSRQALNATSFTEEKAQAAFDIGMQAYALMKLINAEIQSHGTLQEKLIDFAITRCREMGVEIRYFPKKGIYLYDFSAFETYLKTAPRGEYAAAARYALIEKSFYEMEAGDQEPATLREQVRRKKEFLREYPTFKRRAELEMLLTLDYYELSVLYAAKKELKKSQEFKQLTMDQCRHIIDSFPDTDAAASARDLLIKLQI